MRYHFLMLFVVGLLGTALLGEDLRVRDLAQANPDSTNTAPSTEKTSSSSVKKTKSKPKASPGITPEREAATRTFVEQHHPELAELLAHLKQGNSKEYETAVRDLFRTSERLARVHEMDEERYELELKLWQTQSRIDLLVARHKMAPSDELKSQLRNAISEQFVLRKALVELERNRTREKLVKFEEQLQVLERVNDKSVSERLRLLTEVSDGEKTEKPATKVNKTSKVSK